MFVLMHGENMKVIKTPASSLYKPNKSVGKRCFVAKSSTARSFSRLTSLNASTNRKTYVCLKVVAYASIIISCYHWFLLILYVYV